MVLRAREIYPFHTILFHGLVKDPYISNDATMRTGIQPLQARTMNRVLPLEDVPNFHVPAGKPLAKLTLRAVTAHTARRFKLHIQVGRTPLS